jgi:hypothetical protein
LRPTHQEVTAAQSSWVDKVAKLCRNKIVYPIQLPLKLPGRQLKIQVKPFGMLRIGHVGLLPVG